MPAACPSHSARVDCSSAGTRRTAPPRAKDASVADAIESHAAGQHEVLATGEIVRMAGGAEHDLFGDGLNRRRNIHLALRERALRPARRAAEELGETGVGHHVRLAESEVAHVHAKRSVVL